MGKAAMVSPPFLRPEVSPRMEFLIPVIIVLFLGHVGLAGDHLFRVGPLQYALHRFYAIIEPVLLRVTDFLITRKWITGTLPGRFILKTVSLASHYLPHGLVVTTERAHRFVEYIDRVEGPKGEIGRASCRERV